MKYIFKRIQSRNNQDKLVCHKRHGIRIVYSVRATCNCIDYSIKIADIHFFLKKKPILPPPPFRLNGQSLIQYQQATNGLLIIALSTNLICHSSRKQNNNCISTNNFNRIFCYNDITVTVSTDCKGRSINQTI